MNRIIPETQKGKTMFFTDSTIYQNYLDYCDCHDCRPIPEETALIFIHNYADKGYSAKAIYEELKKVRFEDTCYTCPFFEGETRRANPTCCYVGSCKGIHDLVAVVPHRDIKEFLKQIRHSGIKKIREVSIIRNGIQYIKVYKKK